MGEGMSIQLRTVSRVIAAVLVVTACGRADQRITSPESVPSPVGAPYTDMPWDTAIATGWPYTRRSGSKDDDVVTDDSAPFGKADVLRIIFTPDMRRDSEPGVHWKVLPSSKEVYAEWWMKLSPNWKSGPSYGQKVWDPNVSRTPIFYNRWYRIGWYAKWPSKPGGNGTVRWWVDGALEGNYTDVVVFPKGVEGFIQFDFAPTLQFPPPAEQYMYIGPTRVTTW
jgi:hypothetical protein